jgi:branched-subunit amino acid aminotransferase/4-amino-4-deoxychorismate lyase
MRRFLLTHLPGLGWQVQVRPLEWDDLRGADFVMATNSVRLIMPVGSISGVGTWDDGGRLRALWDRLGPILFGL